MSDTEIFLTSRRVLGLTLEFIFSIRSNNCHCKSLETVSLNELIKMIETDERYFFFRDPDDADSRLPEVKFRLKQTGICSTERTFSSNSFDQVTIGP